MLNLIAKWILKRRVGEVKKQIGIMQRYKDAGLHTINFNQWKEKWDWLNKRLSTLESAIRIL